MKGTIVCCLEELVTSKFGKDKWLAILKEVGVPTYKLFTSVEDVEDATVMKAIEATCKVLGITPQQAADAFGEFWVNSYAPKTYKTFFTRVNSARDFLLQMDDIHVENTKRIPNAKPPRFRYEWQDKNTLIMTYSSSRGLIDIAAGLARGVGTYYKEKLAVTVVGADKLKIVFA
jgi:hypothetical protein